MNTDQHMVPEGYPFLRRSEQYYGWLLAAYPKRHREEYGSAMRQVFRDQCRDAWHEGRGWGLAALWLRVLPDLMKTSVQEHLATLNERKSMLERIATMLSSRPTPTTIFLRAFLVVFLLLVTASTVFTFLLPESYASTTRIRVERGTADRTEAGVPAQSSHDPYFIQTQFEFIQSQLILTQVVSALDLSTVWGRKYARGTKLKDSEALTLLRARMDLRPVRDTSLIEIRVFSDDAGEAAQIANSIAETYRDYRLEQRRQLTLAGIRTLEERFREQELKVARAQHEVDTLREKLGISEAEAASPTPIPSLKADTLQHLEALRIENEAQFVREERLLQQLKATPSEDLPRVLPTVTVDPQLNELLSQRNAIEQALIQTKKEVADTHPSVTTAQRQIEDLNRKIRERTDGILKGMGLRVASLKGHLESLASNVDKAKEADAASAAKSRPYYEARQRLDGLTRFRNTLNLKLASEQIDMNLPRLPPVEIVDRATPGFHPARPNKPLILIVGVLGGGLIALAVAAVIAWLSALGGNGPGGGSSAAGTLPASDAPRVAGGGAGRLTEKLAGISRMLLGGRGPA